MYSDGQLAQNLTVKIDSREPYFKTNKFGEYYRILLPGTYKLELLVNCDPIYETVITITESEALVTHNVMLKFDQKNLTYHHDISELNRFGQFCSTEKNLVNCSLDYTFLVLDSLHNYNSSHNSKNDLKLILLFLNIIGLSYAKIFY
jgi:hypothetical protein